MATLAALRKEVVLTETRLRADVACARRELLALDWIYRRRPATFLAAAFGVGWLSACWLTPAQLVGGVFRFAARSVQRAGRRHLAQLFY
jgi:hypothetical protein